MEEEAPRAKKVIKGTWFYRKIYHRLHHRNNWMLACCGETGTGKSWASLRMAYDLDVCPRTWEHRFPLDASRVFFDPEEFVKTLRGKDLPKGSFLILDEAALNLSNITWWDLTARALTGVAQSFRYMQFGLIYTFPGSLGMLNKSLRILSHHALVMRGVNTQKGFSLGDFTYLQTNVFSAKTYRHKPSNITEEGIEDLDTFTFYAPPKELCRAYEAKKEAYLKGYYGRLAEDMAKAKAGRMIDMRKYFDMALENPREYMDASLRFKSSLLRVKFNLSRQNAACLASALNIEKRAGRIKTVKRGYLSE